MRYRQDLISFLKKCKANIRNGRWRIIPREVNNPETSNFTMSLEQRKLSLLQLTTSDWLAGPEKDLDANRQGYVWVFHKRIVDRPYYIKIKLTEHDRYTKVISFHSDRYVD